MQSLSVQKFAMNRIVGATFLVAGIALLCGAALVGHPKPSPLQSSNSGKTTLNPDGARRMAAIKLFGQSPVAFEENQGQADPKIKYLARGGSASILLTTDGPLIAFNSGILAQGKIKASANTAEALKALTNGQAKPHVSALKLSFQGVARHPTLRGLDRLPQTTNYLIGLDSSKWHQGIVNFGRVKYQSIYPGIDLAFYGNEHRLEYDIDLAPGADPRAVKMKVQGADSLALDHNGNLVATVADQRVLIGKPLAYQQNGTQRELVNASFVLDKKSQVTLALGAYDHKKALVVDPALMFSTFIGGASAKIEALAVDPNGNAYIAGTVCCGTGLPVVGGVQSTLNGIDNAFVAKLGATGTILYSTYLGGSQMDFATGIAFDSAGNAYVTGYTDSPNFPTKPAGSSLGGGFDGFIAVLNPGGNSLVYSQYLGGSANDIATGVAVDPKGSAYVVGQTFSTNFPTTNENAYQVTNPSDGAVSEGFLVRLDPPTTTGGAPNLYYSTYFGGPAPSGSTPTGMTFLNGAAFGGKTGNVFVAGSAGASAPATITTFGGLTDAIVADFDTTQAGTSSLVFSRFIGGSSIDVATGISTATNCVWPCAASVSGYTFSADIPGSILQFGGAEDGFLAEVDADSGVRNFTYVGTAGYEDGDAANLNSSGTAVLGGVTTQQSDFFITEPIQNTPGINGALLRSLNQGVNFSTDTAWPSTFGSISPGALAIDLTVPTNVIPDGEVIYAGTNSNGLYISTNGGASFAGVSQFFGAQVTGIALAKIPPGSKGPAPTYVTADNQLFFSQNLGQTWASLSSLPAGSRLPANPFFVAADFTAGIESGTPNSDFLVWQGNKNGIYVSTDEGVDFTASTGITAPPNAAVPSPLTQVFSGVEDVSQGLLYIGTDKGVFVSDDMGFTFSPTIVNADVIFSMAIDTTTTPHTVYAGTFGDGAYASTDGFVLPQNLTHTMVETNTTFNYVTVDDSTSNPAIVYLGAGDSLRQGTMWKSVNAGTSFTQIGGATFPQPFAMFPITVAHGVVFASDFREAQSYFFQENNLGSSLQFAAPFGGSNYSEVTGVGTDSNNDIYLAGLTFASNYPTLNAAEGTFAATGVNDDGFVSKFGFTSTGVVTVPVQVGFPYTTLRTDAKPITVTVSNTGKGPVEFGYIRVANGNNYDFFIIPGKSTVASLAPCGTTLAAGAKCGIEVDFEPLQPGQRASELIISSNSNNGDQFVTLVGTGS